MTKNRGLISIMLMASIACAGCTALRSKDLQIPPKTSLDLNSAKQLYSAHRYSEALVQCNDIARVDPFTSGLPELRKKIVVALTAERAKIARLRSDTTNARMQEDVDNKKNLPETYALRQPVVGDNSSLTSKPSSMEKVLDLPVTLHFTDLPLSEMALGIGAAANVNIIVDSAIASAADKSLTVHVEDAPLSEVLDFVSRNLGVTFFAGDNIIWVTESAEPDSKVPMITRMYRLRKGLANLNLQVDGGVDESDIALLKAIDLFVPTGGGDGSAIFFDKNTHVLIVKNTRQKLTEIEKIIEELDRIPPQILIEARFISTGINDLRELGVNWNMHDPLTTSTKLVPENSKLVQKTRTQIRDGELVKLPPSEMDTQGLNLTYQGILTAPRFEAILHALESKQHTRTLSVPRITTMNNNAATIHVGEKFLYWKEFEPVRVVAYEDETGRIHYEDRMAPVGEPDEKELGITLNVTPTVGADLKTITLKLNPHIEEFVRYEEQMVASSSRNNNRNVNVNVNNAQGATTNSSLSLMRLPIFREQDMATKVVVATGETVVLGGLITTIETKKVTKVPILGSIPLIGRLFQSEGVGEQNQNLLVFVTATLISQRGESLVPVDK